MYMWLHAEIKEREIMSAKVELTKLRAANVLTTNNDLAAEIHIAGIVVGISVNERLQTIIQAEIEEIEKFLAGEPNNYE